MAENRVVDIAETDNAGLISKETLYTSVLCFISECWPLNLVVLFLVVFIGVLWYLSKSTNDEGSSNEKAALLVISKWYTN